MFPDFMLCSDFENQFPILTGIFLPIFFSSNSHLSEKKDMSVQNGILGKIGNVTIKAKETTKHMIYTVRNQGVLI